MRCVVLHSNAAQIWRKVSQGVKPLVLQRIGWSEVRLFIEMCLSPADLRPTARELLSHPFLVYSNPSTDDKVCPVREKEDAAAPRATSPRAAHKHAAQQIPHLPIAPSPHTQQVTAQLQTIHTTHNVPSSSPQQAAVAPHHQRNRSPNEPSLPANLQPLPLNRHVSHEQQQQQQQQPLQPQQPRTREREGEREQDAALPAVYAGLTLNTSTSSSSAHQSAASSPSHAATPQHGSFASTQRSGSARPPSISTQQPHQSTSPATRAAQQQRSTVSSPHHTQSSGLAANMQVSTSYSLHSTAGTGQSPTPTSTSSPLPTAAAGSVQSILVEVDGVSDAVAQVTLHIGLGEKRKKQIKFPFDFRLDNSYGVAAEMVKLLKLPDAAKTEMLIAVELESKLDPWRKHYFVTMGGRAAAGGATQPVQQQQHHHHQQHQQQQQPQQQQQHHHVPQQPHQQQHHHHPQQHAVASHHLLPSHAPYAAGLSPHPLPPALPSQHFPLPHGNSTSQVRLSSPAPPPHHVPSFQPQHVPVSHAAAYSTVLHHLQSQQLSPAQPSHSLASRMAHASTSSSGATVSPPHSSPSTPALSRHLSQQSTPAASPHGSLQQQQPRAGPPLLHTQSLSSVPLVNVATPSPSPNLRRSTVSPLLGMPVVNVTAAVAAGAAVDKSKDGIPRSPLSATVSSPTLPAQSQQPLQPSHQPHTANQPQHAHPQQTHAPQATLQQAQHQQATLAPTGGSALHTSVSQPSLDLRVDPTQTTTNTAASQGQHSLTPPALPTKAAQPQLSGARKDVATGAAPTAVDARQSRASPATTRYNRRLSQSNIVTQQLDSPLDVIDVAQSPLRRSRSDFSPQQPTISIYSATAALPSITPTSDVATSPTQPMHGRSDSLNKLYTNLTVAQLKERIRAKGGASRLADCIEKKDLVECLIQLTPLSPLPHSPNPAMQPSAGMSEGLQVPGNNSLSNDPPSAPSSRSNSRHSNRRPSSPDALVNSPPSSQTAAREGKDKDPFADLFTPTNANLRSAHTQPNNGHSSVAGSGHSSSSPYLSSRSFHDTPSPLSATSPHLSPNHFSPTALADPLSPTRPAVQRPASNPASVRSSTNRPTSHPLVGPNQLLGRVSSPLLNALNAFTAPAASSSILPTDPFAHLDARQHSGQHALDNWHDYFSDQADKHATALPALDPLEGLHMHDTATRAAAGQIPPPPTDYFPHDGKGAASKAVGSTAAAMARRGASELSGFFEPPSLNGDSLYHKQS